MEEELRIQECLVTTTGAFAQWVCAHQFLADVVVFSVVPLALIVVFALAAVSFVHRKQPYAPSFGVFLADTGMKLTFLATLWGVVSLLLWLLNVEFSIKS